MRTILFSSVKIFLCALIALVPLCNISAHTNNGKAPIVQQQKKQSKKKAKTKVEPLFGKKLQNVEIKSDKLKGACFYIVSGHGGPDPGAVNSHNGHELCEDEYAYDVALRLARNLMEEGAEVRIIIQDKNDGIRSGTYLKDSKSETCMGARIPESQKARLRQRTDKINSLYKKDKKKYKYVRAIFLHVDSRSTGTNIDVEFYHAKGSRSGEKTAIAIRDMFKQKYKKHNPKRGYNGKVGVHPKRLYVVNNTYPPAILIELANIRNSRDLKRIIIEDNRQAMANWMREALIKDYKAK